MKMPAIIPANISKRETSDPKDADRGSVRARIMLMDAIHPARTQRGERLGNAFGTPHLKGVYVIPSGRRLHCGIGYGLDANGYKWIFYLRAAMKWV